MIDLTHLQAFCKVVEAGSFSAAGALLGVQKSTVSRQIALLERDFGRPLFYRTTRKLEVTEVGRQLLANTHTALRTLELSLAALHRGLDDTAGSLHVTASEDMGVLLLSKVIADFSGRFPAVRINLGLTDKVLDPVADSVDIALRVGKPKQQSLRARRLGMAEFLLAASPGYWEHQTLSTSIDGLGMCKLLTYGPRDNDDSLLLVNGRSSRRINCQVRAACRSMLALSAMAEAGAGVAVLPRFVAAQGLRDGRLIELFPGWAPASRPVYLLSHGSIKSTALVKHFMDLAAPVISALLLRRS